MPLELRQAQDLARQLARRVDTARFGREMGERTTAFTRELRQGTSRSELDISAASLRFRPASSTLALWLML
jgi:hypothetical protein